MPAASTATELPKVNATPKRAARGLATLQPKPPAKPPAAAPAPALTPASANAEASDSKTAAAPSVPKADAKANAKADAKGSNAHPLKAQRIAVGSLKSSAAPAPKWGDDDAGTGGGASKAAAKTDAKPDASKDVKAKPKPAGAPGSGGGEGKTKPSPGIEGAADESADDPDGGADARLNTVKSFDDLKLHDSILRGMVRPRPHRLPPSPPPFSCSFVIGRLRCLRAAGVYAYGYEVPSVIQSRAIAPVIAGHDTIAQAQSGTGKTATFVIAALQRLDLKAKNAQVLILSPTRELANQTFRVAKALADYHGPAIHLCTGGTLTAVDRQALAAGAQLVVGTPGRVLALLGNGGLKAKHLKLMILDEADEILSQGFQEQMYSIFEHLPSTIQVALFSATLPPEALELSKRFMRSPVRIIVKKEEVTLEGIKQFYVDLNGNSAERGGWDARARGRHAASASDDQMKLECLIDLYETISVSQCVIFANTRRRVEWLQRELNERDFTVSAIHSDLEYGDRQKVMAEFRLGASRVLIATDVVARGIDVQGVSLVINFDLPKEQETYIHRIGRSGRFGRKGVAINFVCTRNDVEAVAGLQHFYATTINELPADIKDLI